MVKNRLVYMDNNATTPMAAEVVNALSYVENEVYGNASSMHLFGRTASTLVEKARKSVATMLDCLPEEIIFTSGASESNNTVFMIAEDLIRRGKGKRILISSIEHPSIISVAGYLRGHGVFVDTVPVDKEGRVILSELKKMITDDVVLVSVMTANNETGTIQDVEKISAMAHEKGALFHTDATQAIGKLPVSCRNINADYLSLSGHKFYGPKGVGVLYIKKGAPFVPFVHGGEQENGRRAGTYNTASIYGIGVAAELAVKNLEEERIRLWEMREHLREGIIRLIPDVVINGSEKNCLPGTLNVSFPRAEGESILLMLDMKGVAVSTGSACATGSLEPSYVLLASGLDVELAHGSIRFSLGRYNSMEDVDYVLQVLPPIISNLRALSTR